MTSANATGRPGEVRVLKPGLDGGSGDGRKLFVVGFDPGVTTGWCVMRLNLEALLMGGLRAVACANPDPELFAWSAGYFQGPEPYQAELMLAMVRGTWMHSEGVFDEGALGDAMVIVVEDFKLRELNMSDELLAPVRVTAMFQMLSWRSLYVPVLTQSASDAMNVLTDARLKSLNLWSGVPGKLGEHQRDATRHAGVIARKCSDGLWLRSLETRMKWLREPPGIS